MHRFKDRLQFSWNAADIFGLPLDFFITISHDFLHVLYMSCTQARTHAQSATDPHTTAPTTATKLVAISRPAIFKPPPPSNLSSVALPHHSAESCGTYRLLSPPFLPGPL